MPVCLVVEDHSDTRDGYVEFFGFYGFDVLTAAGEDEMWQSLDRELPDVIVMDLHLPKTDGYSLIRQLKANERTRSIPVLVVSASVRPEDQERARRAGSDAFVAKPCDPASIVTQLKALLASKPGAV